MTGYDHYACCRSRAYALAMFGLDPEDLRHRFKAYTEYFGIQAESDTR